MPDQERKYFFDANVFDAPPPDVAPDNAPPPPPTFSEEELSAARDMAFEQGRQQGRREEIEARDQIVAQTLGTVADGLSHLLAAETIRESVFEKEALRLAIHSLDLLFPLLDAKIGRAEVMAILEKTLSDHRKAKEITITVPAGMKDDVGALLARLRENETEPALWRVTEDPAMRAGDCRVEWSDGGAVRDSGRAAQAVRTAMERLLDNPVDHLAPPKDGDGIPFHAVVSYGETSESDDQTKGAS